MLVQALIQVESNYKPQGAVAEGRHGADAADAVDGAGIQGPQPLRPKANIEAGIKHLKALIDRSAWSWRSPRTTPAKARW